MLAFGLLSDTDCDRMHPPGRSQTRPGFRRRACPTSHISDSRWGAAATPEENERMAKIQAVWALDIGQAALKALKLVPGETPDQVVAEAFDYVEYPKILSQPDADPEQLVREALETFLERNDLKGCKVAIAVPGQAGLVKFIKLPPVEKKRIPDIVKFEAQAADPLRARGGRLGLPADRRRRGRRATKTSRWPRSACSR